VYQLYMYMDVGGFDKGYVVAGSFTTGAKVAADHIGRTHNKQVTIATLDQFPITHAPSDQERVDYY
jgi:hypothetical protein